MCDETMECDLGACGLNSHPDLSPTASSPPTGIWVPVLGRITVGYGESGSCSVVSNSLQTHGLYSPWNSPGQNTGVGSLFCLQELFPTQRLNPGLPNCRWILYQLSHKGSPWGYSGCHDYPRVGTSSFSPSRG